MVGKFDASELMDNEDGSVDFWEKKQRELVTSVVDYNLSTLASLVSDGDIDVQPKYQRRYRWDNTKKSKLIESFLMNVPVPPIFLNEDAYGKYSVIDGKQRLNAITEFFKGKLCLTDLKVFSDINNMSFDDLPKKLQTVIKTRPTLRAIIILRQSDEDVKFEVFQRLNTGGVTLNAQEIRNSTYPGPLNDLILELSENKIFHQLLGIKNKNDSKIYQEMRDAELVLRFFTFKDTWKTFNGGMKRHMDHYVAINQRLDVDKLKELKEDFLQTLKIAEEVFGIYIFKRWLPEKNIWKKQILASLYDAQMFACYSLYKDKYNIVDKNTLIDNLKVLFSDEDFRKAIDAATNTPTYFKNRINIMRDMIMKERGA